MYQEYEAVSSQTFLLHSFNSFLAWPINATKGLFSISIFGIILHNSLHPHLREGIIHFSNEGSVARAAFSAFWEGLLKASS